MKSLHRTLRALLPLLLVLALAVSYPFFNRGFTDGVSFLRLQFGQLGTQLAVAPAAGGLLLGIYKPEVPYSLSRLQEMEEAIGTPFHVLSFYQTWGDREQDAFPHALMRAADQHGAMVMLTWEPWTTEFARHRGDRTAAVRTDMRAIADGAYDVHVRRWAREASIFGKVFFLRLAHEMNNPQYPWSEQAGNGPADIIEAWR
ncbi:MAG: hypothetical protein KY464_18135, partial [Gemmatimonadetes bacterium]|nr:hypothetical protein [Gemmatimonadota bacterium]